MKHHHTDLNKDVSALTRVDRRLTLSFGILILALMLSVLFSSSFYLKGVMDREEKQLSTLLTQILATSISRVSFSGRYHAQLLLEDIQNEFPDIMYIHVTDLKGQFLASTNKLRIGKKDDSDSGVAINKILMNTVSTYTRQIKYKDEHIIEISLPYQGSFQHTIQGVVQVGLSHKTKHQEITKGIVLITIMVLVLLIISIVFVRKISRHFGNPIQYLASDMAATLQAIPDLLFELDLEGRYIQIMAHKPELLADTRDQLLGKNIHDALSSEAAAEVSRALDEANQVGESHGREISLLLPTGLFWFELSVARKSQSTSKNTHFIVLSRDITERKKTDIELNSHRLHLEELVQERTIAMQEAKDEAERANKAKSEFLSNMSHELRTPMNAIIGFAQMLELDADNLNSVQNDNIQEIIVAGDHLLKLINDVLDLARIESGTLDITIDNVSIDDLLIDCISLIQPLLAKQKIKLINIFDYQQQTVLADATRLKQIIINILSNAIKYNINNGTITLESEVINNDRLRVSISNTGNILSQDQIDKIFVPFERLDAGYDTEGTGIGLSICKQIIKDMNGEIGVESNIDKGNTFWIELILSHD